ncbi:MAG: phage tail-type lysozyme domain-containing protein, partial [Candidatus Nomurabacteria bacterium]|nr:phage tail-type lysozyme domain-containing protein [Candidatus Nomurabacteria bacterium]
MLKKILILFIVAVQLLGLPASVYAAKMDEIFYSQNDIVWYDPTGGACVAASTGVSGSTAIEKVWSGLIWVGFSPEQAAGIMGNMQSESAFSPTRHETSFLTGGNKSASTKSDFDTNAGYSYGIGLIQWSFGRRVKAINKLKEANLYDPYIKSPETYSMPGQELIDSGLIEDAVLNNIYAVELQFLNQEVNDVKSYRGIFDQTTVEDATQFFLEHVEIPKNPTLSHHPERLTQAEAIYAMYKSGQLSSSASAGSAIPGSTNPENASNIEWLSDIPGLTKGEPDGATGAGGGQTFASGQPTKIVLHDTEETGWPDYTSSSSAKGAYAPHFTVNLKEKKGRQHFALNKTSGATTNGDAESIQIEIVGFVTNKSVSGVDSNYVLHNMADEDWDYLAKYLIAINKATGIPLTSSVNWNNSGPNDTHQTTDVRMTKSDWNAYKGVLGHMHVPGDDHWDPGPIWSKVQAAVERSGDSSACKSDAGNGDVNATAL